MALRCVLIAPLSSAAMVKLFGIGNRAPPRCLGSCDTITPTEAECSKRRTISPTTEECSESSGADAATTEDEPPSQPSLPHRDDRRTSSNRTTPRITIPLPTGASAEDDGLNEYSDDHHPQPPALPDGTEAAQSLSTSQQATQGNDEGIRFLDLRGRHHRHPEHTEEFEDYLIRSRIQQETIDESLDNSAQDLLEVRPDFNASAADPLMMQSPQCSPIDC